MPRYRVELTRTTTAVGYLDVEAADAEEAERIAEERLGSEDPDEADVTFGAWEVTHGGTELADEGSGLIVTLSWLEPEPGSDSKVAVLTEEEAEEVEEAVRWLKERAGDEWGVTIAAVELSWTNAEGGDLAGLRPVLEHLATNCRYDTGEGIYDGPCPVFAAHGIARS